MSLVSLGKEKSIICILPFSIECLIIGSPHFIIALFSDQKKITLWLVLELATFHDWDLVLHSWWLFMTIAAYHITWSLFACSTTGFWQAVNGEIASQSYVMSCLAMELVVPIVVVKRRQPVLCFILNLYCLNTTKIVVCYLV